ncbi:Small GTPase superfamily, partial [Trinorchestia longiramus]
QQFVRNEFPHDHSPTRQRHTYWTSAIARDRLYQLSLADLPPIHGFPTSSLQEWSEYRQFGLRSAAAYLLVFDLNCPESFVHIKHLRDQIHESRDLHEVALL